MTDELKSTGKRNKKMSDKHKMEKEWKKGTNLICYKTVPEKNKK